MYRDKTKIKKVETLLVLFVLLMSFTQRECSHIFFTSKTYITHLNFITMYKKLK